LDDVNQQASDYKKFSDYFGINDIPITYYSCINPEELFRIKGFDYSHRQFIDSLGGLAESGGLVFSGNNSEYYPHELAHIFINTKFPNGTSHFLDEGLATFLGGSCKFPYSWHKSRFKDFLLINKSFDCSKHLNPYENIYYSVYTPINYMIAATICEFISNSFGKPKLFELLNSNLTTSEIFTSLKIKESEIDSLVRTQVLAD